MHSVTTDASCVTMSITWRLLIGLRVFHYLHKFFNRTRICKMDDETGEGAQLIKRSPHNINGDDDIKVYKRRWYILVLFTLLNATANFLWNTWPPIQESCQLVFGWNKNNVLIIGAVQAVGSIISIVPSSWLLDTKGLRVAAFISVGIQMVGVCIQLLPVETTVRTGLITAGEFLISVAVPPVQNVGVLVLSANWFPPHERMTATAIATLASYLGSAASYVVGPNIVPDVEYGNITYQAGHGIDINTIRKNMSEKQLHFILNRIDQFLMLEAVLIGILFFTVWIYFPAKPPKPPSRSSAVGRVDFTVGAKMLLSNHQFWLLLLVFSASNGVSWGWSSVQDLIFSGVGIDQKTAGWLGFWANVASLLGIVFSWYTDRLTKYTKLVLLLLFLCAGGAQTILSLACDQVIPLTKGVFYTSGIAQTVLLGGTVPLTMELAAECTYPVAEGITSGVMVLCVWIINMVFFIAFMFPQANPRFMNWLLVGSTFSCVPLVSLYQERYRRLDVDTKES